MLLLSSPVFLCTQWTGNHCNPRFSRGVPCPSYPNQLHLCIGFGSVYQLCCSKEGKEPPSTKNHPLSECRLLCSGPTSRLEECLAHRVSALLTPKLSLNFLSHKNCRVCHGVWTRHWQGDEGEAAVDQGQSHNYLAYCVASISIFSYFFLLL